MDKHEQVDVDRTPRQVAQQEMNAETTRPSGLEDADAIVGVWLCRDNTIQTHIVPPKDWDDPEVWGAVLAGIVRHLVKQYEVLHPDRKPLAIQNRIVHRLHDELRI